MFNNISYFEHCLRQVGQALLSQDPSNPNHAPVLYGACGVTTTPLAYFREEAQLTHMDMWWDEVHIMDEPLPF